MNNKKQKGFSTLIIIIGIVFLAVVGGLGWYFFTNQPQQRSTLQQPLVTAATTENGVLRVGETIDENGLAADTKEFQPFIDYLVSKLKNQGITKGEFVGVRSVSEMAELVREDKIDVVIDSAFPVYVVSKLAGAEVFADRWKGGVGTYHSAIFVRQDNPIKTVDDLKGKILAFDSTTSTVGYFLPKAELIKQGYTLTQKNKPTDLCKPTEICYIFVHGNVYESVANGTVPSGAESELEIDGYFGKNIINYRIITKMPDIPRFLVAARGNMNPSLKDSIKNVLFTMNTTSEGKSVLASFADTSQFTPVANNDATYGVIKDLTNIVEQEIIQQ